MPISWYSVTSLHISHAWQSLDSEVRDGLLVKSPQKRLYEFFDLYMVSPIWFKSRLVIKVSFWKDSLPEEIIVTFIVKQDPEQDTVATISTISTISTLKPL